ncbi:MAG: citramalate synthase [Proteobacteria bacterium]|nr:citramalate synthase [Pseudomonadota bacterium]
MKKTLLFDTTLRDGTQGENISFTPEDKLRVAQKLDDIGIHYIECGWPGSSPGAMEFFKMLQGISLKHTVVTAFGSTRRPGIRPEEDANLAALIECQAPAITLFGKTWDLHVLEIMGNTLEENLAMITDSIGFIKHHGLELLYDAEHFFDGYKANPDYAMETLVAALKGGADMLVLCDTNGGSLPHEVEGIIHEVMAKLGDKGFTNVSFGIHAHNDCAMGVANAIAAVRAGASMVQGTINGYGERCGNTDLTAVIPILCLKMNDSCMDSENIKKLKSLSRFVSETSNMIPLSSRPFVGRSAFTHKAGVHVSAIMKNPVAYEHMEPTLVGNTRRVLVSDQSGRSNIEYKAKELGIDLESEAFDTRRFVSEIKLLEQDGYQYDIADGSLKILMDKFRLQHKPRFELEAFRVTVEKDKERPCTSHAMIKIAVDGKTEITAAEGAGPVSALDNALRKGLDKFYDQIADMHLVDFKVRVIDGRDGTEAKVRVLIESRDHEDIWTTVGVSEDIIEASWQALEDSFQYKLAKSLNKSS